MARVYLSLGSNINRHHYIRVALDTLRQVFGELVVSPVYESEAVGFDGDNFYNLVVGLHTGSSVGELQRKIKAIEDENGRVRGGPKFSSRTLDIDILTYDDCVGVIDGVALPRDEIVHNAFVLWPLADVAGTELHPQLQRSYGELWSEYDKSKQALWRVELN